MENINQKRSTQIEIDIDVYKEIQNRIDYIGEPANAVLRRVFQLEEDKQKHKAEVITNKSNTTGGLYSSNTLLPNGLKLRKYINGKWHYAEVKNDVIVYNNKKFTSPSAAGFEVTQFPVNGWLFWEYEDIYGNWKLIDSLRKK